MSDVGWDMSDPVQAVLALAYHLGVRNLGEATSCWEQQIDDRWWVAINPTRDEKATSKGGPALPPASVYVEFNGWPAGLLSFMHGGEFAAGEAANPDTFAAAITARMAAA